MSAPRGFDEGPARGRAERRSREHGRLGGAGGAQARSAEHRPGVGSLDSKVDLGDDPGQSSAPFREDRTLVGYV